MRSPSRKSRVRPRPIGSPSRLRKVPLVDKSAICQEPDRNAITQWHFDRPRSGSGRTQSLSGPRPIENSPPVTERVCGGTASGQRNIVSVRVITHSLGTSIREGRRSLAKQDIRKGDESRNSKMLDDGRTGVDHRAACTGRRRLTTAMKSPQILHVCREDKEANTILRLLPLRQPIPISVSSRGDTSWWACCQARRAGAISRAR